MGLRGGGDLYSPKWITAEIEDSGGRLFIVPIKYTLGDYFVTEIEGLIYGFRIIDSKIKTYRHTMVKSWRKLFYNTDNYMPISASDVSALEKILFENGLPKVDKNLMDIFQILSKQEGKDEKFKLKTPHDFNRLFTQLSDKQKTHPEAVSSMMEYITELGKDKKIVDPVKRISDFLEGEVRTSDAKYVGTIYEALERTSVVRKKILNYPETGKGPWMKMVVIIGFAAIAMGIVAWGISSGAFSGLVPQFGGQAGMASPQDCFAKYPTPQAAKAAIDRGEVSLSDFPKQCQDYIKNVKTPAAVAAH